MMFEQRREGGVIFRDADVVVAIGQGLTEADFEAVRIAAGMEGAARGSAHGSRGIVVGELHSFLGQVVDERRLVFGAAIGAEVAVAEVVREDEQDVGACGARGQDVAGGPERGGGDGGLDKVASMKHATFWLESFGV